jgi:hypothetical protein
MVSSLHGALSPLVQVMAVIAVAITASWRAWIAYRAAVVGERERTSRMARAIEGADPNQRPEIIRACSLLEGAARREPEDTDGNA